MENICGVANIGFYEIACMYIMLGLWFQVMFCYSTICLGVIITKAMASGGKIQQTTIYMVYLVVALIRWFGESHKYRQIKCMPFRL